MASSTAAAVLCALAPAMAQPATTATTGPASGATVTSTSKVPATAVPATVGPAQPVTSTAPNTTVAGAPPRSTGPAPAPGGNPSTAPAGSLVPGQIPEFSVTPPPTTPGSPPPASLSPGAVSSILDSLARSSPSSTGALLDALRPLQDYGLSATDAAIRGMGRFPLAGQAYYRDDFGEPREGPPPHPHAGTDIFAPFDTPVRAPASGRVELSDSGLGGKGVTVTEPDGTFYFLAHLNSFAPGLASGASVVTGQVVGFNGDSGNAKGGAPHVHMEIHPQGGAAINPKPILDRWLTEALAGVPGLLAPYERSTLLGGDNSRAIMAVGLARHIGRGMLEGPSRLLSRPPEGATPAPDRRLGDVLLDSVTPAMLRR